MALRDVIIESLRRPASVATVGGFRPPADPLTSWLGQVTATGIGEPWPTCDGAPMIGVCQIVVSELPFVPPAMSDLALFSVFMRAHDGYPVPPVGVDDGGWEIRTYADLAEVERVDPPAPRALKPFPVRWHAITGDLPTWDDAVRVLSSEQWAEVEDEFHDLVPGPTDGFKVGGWPTLMQSEIYWAPGNRHPAAPEYVVQIDGDDKAGIAWGDGGVLYVGRGSTDPDVWALEWQCM